MEARGPSNVNIVDVAASQPCYNVRSTDDINKGESSATMVDPHHCAIFLQQQTKQKHNTARPRLLQWRACQETTLMSYPTDIDGWPEC